MVEYVCRFTDADENDLLPLSEKSLEMVILDRVTRCKDCVHSEPCPLAFTDKLICAFHDEMLVRAGDFCSFGESREDSNE